jgi:Flp pilus assembly protein TadG
MSLRRLTERVRAYTRRENGAAAAEFAIWLTLLAPVVINVVDLAVYAYDRVQVANAGQSAAQAAWAIANSTPCTIANNGLDTSKNPSSSCTGLDTAVNDAIAQSSVLGGASPGQITRPSTTSGGKNPTTTYTGEAYGYYCPAKTTYTLTSTAGTTCSASAVNAATSGYYYKIRVTFTYRPLFGGASVTNLLGTTMTQDTWIRLQ